MWPYNKKITIDKTNVKMLMKNDMLIGLHLGSLSLFTASMAHNASSIFISLL